MDVKERQSWLSSLLEQTDRLILAIGGYESAEDEASLGNVDDEEGGTDGEWERHNDGTDGELERHRGGSDGELEHHKGGTDGELERHKDCRAVDRIMPDDKVLTLQPQAFDDSEEESEGDRDEHQQAQEMVPLKATQSSQTQIYFSSPDISSPNANPEDITARHVTPHHSRAGIAYRTPPEVGVSRAGGGFSRRAPRESKVKHEVFEGAEFNAIDAIPASTALGVQLEGNHIETSKAKTATFECSASGASVASTAAAPAAVTVAKASGGKRGGKKFSYANDTAWLRATPKLRTSTASSPPSNKATGGLLRPSPIQRGPTLGSTCFDSLNASEDGRKQDLDCSGGREGVLNSPCSIPGWGLTKLTEMEQQLQRDLIAAAYPEAETDSQEVEKLSADSSDDEAADRVGEDDERDGDDSDGARQAGVESYLSGEVIDGVAESSNVRSESMIHAESEATMAGAVDLGAGGASVTPTIGAKRDSAGNSFRQEPLAEFSNSDAGPQYDVVTTPSKRGKTRQRYRLGVMRHSSRLDDAIHDQQRKLQKVNGRDGDRGELPSWDGESDLELSVPWPDKDLRPYDTPIVDNRLPAVQAMELAELGFTEETLIFCSPFRRCLQTAGVVARTLGVFGVTVCLDVGERMDKVRKEISDMANAAQQNGASTAKKNDRENRKPVFSYLDRAGTAEALGPGVRLEGVIGEQPPDDETGVEAKQRFIDTIARLRQKELQESPVLVVAHGDTLDAAGESLASQIIYEADYCAWAVFDLDTHYGHIAESYGIQMIPL